MEGLDGRRRWPLDIDEDGMVAEGSGGSDPACLTDGLDGLDGRRVVRIGWDEDKMAGKRSIGSSMD